MTRLNSDCQSDVMEWRPAITAFRSQDKVELDQEDRVIKDALNELIRPDPDHHPSPSATAVSILVALSVHARPGLSNRS
jgi:hypothetical protein